MHPSPASVTALLLVFAALSLIALTLTAAQPRRVDVREADRRPARQSEGAAQRKRERERVERRAAARRATPATPEATPAPAVAAPEATPAPAVAAPEAATPAPPPAAPEATPGPAPVPPETVVAAYYRALDAGRFDDAWATLAPAVQTAFGDFERWRAGYDTTTSSRPEAISVQRDGAIAAIVHELATEDRSPCGPVRRRFEVRWRLLLEAGEWRAASLTAVKRSGAEPDAACAARHDAARGGGGR